MSFTWLGVMVALTAILGVVGYFTPSPMKSYWERSCAGFAWRKEFPGASKSEIRKFLGMFIAGFSFRPEYLLKFRPTDRPMEIYRTLYPSAWHPDALELETFVKLVRKQFGVDLAPVWNDDITLGEIFRLLHGGRPNHSFNSDPAATGR